MADTEEDVKKDDTSQEIAETWAAVQQQLNANNPRLAEPEEDEIGDEVIFVVNGWVRLIVTGKVFKLRRPFLGELQALETSLEAAREELTEMNDKLRSEGDKDLQRAREIEEEVKGAKAAKRQKLDDEITELALKAGRRQRQIQTRADELRILWWEQVFETLTPPGNKKPEDQPTWVLDPQLQHQIVAHWRDAPLARGSR